MSENALLYRILKQYYIEGISQKKIAELEGVSTATVSRAIKEGIKRGYVRVSLDLPENSVPNLEEAIKAHYGLNMVRVLDSEVENQEIIMHDVASAFSSYFTSILKPGDIIGLSWGRTLSAVADFLKPKKIPGLTFVSMNGGVAEDVSKTGVGQVVRAFAKPFQASAYSLLLPIYVSSEKVVNELKKDGNVKNIFDMIEKANIAVFSVGGLIHTSLLFKSGYLSEESCKKMREEGYVGDICSRFFKRNGSQVVGDLDMRSVGISLEELKKKPKKICIVADKEKAEALSGALNGGYVDDLFVDKKTALELLKLQM